MKTIIFLLVIIICFSCSTTPNSIGSNESNHTLNPPGPNCCAHWTGTSCAHELIPGCSQSFSPFNSPANAPLINTPWNSSNCAHIGADGTCYHPL